MAWTLPEALSPTARLDALEAHLRHCAEMLDAGTPDDMKGVDAEVGRLCRQVLALPEEEAQSLSPRLEMLAAAFGALGEATKEMRDAVRDELGNLQARHAAHRAYGISGALPGKTTAENDE